MKPSEIVNFSSTLKEKDESGIKYFFEISGSMDSESENLLPVTIVRTTGSDKFNELIEKAKANKFKTIEYKEYGSNSRTAKPTLCIKFNLVSSIPAVSIRTNRQNNRKNSSGFSGFEGLEGFGGLQGLMALQTDNSKLNFELLYNQDKLSDQKERNDSLKGDFERVSNEIKSYEVRNKELEEENKRLKNNLQLGNIAATGILGFVSNKLGVGKEMIASLLGFDTDMLDGGQKPTVSAKQNEPDLSSVQVNQSAQNSIAKMLCDWIVNLDESNQKRVYSMVLYYHEDQGRLNEVSAIVEALKKKTDNVVQFAQQPTAQNTIQVPSTNNVEIQNTDNSNEELEEGEEYEDE